MVNDANSGVIYIETAEYGKTRPNVKLFDFNAMRVYMLGHDGKQLKLQLKRVHHFWYYKTKDEAWIGFLLEDCLRIESEYYKFLLDLAVGK